jgi:hypothetical protein
MEDAARGRGALNKAKRSGDKPVERFVACIFFYWVKIPLRRWGVA